MHARTHTRCYPRNLWTASVEKKKRSDNKDTILYEI